MGRIYIYIYFLIHNRPRPTALIPLGNTSTLHTAHVRMFMRTPSHTYIQVRIHIAYKHISIACVTLIALTDAHAYSCLACTVAMSKCKHYERCFDLYEENNTVTPYVVMSSSYYIGLFNKNDVSDVFYNTEGNAKLMYKPLMLPLPLGKCKLRGVFAFSECIELSVRVILGTCVCKPSIASVQRLPRNKA